MSKTLDKIASKLEKAKQMLLEKAIKPGPTLDYATINPKDNTQVSPKAKNIVAATSAATEAAAPTIDYKAGTMEAPKRYAGAAEKAAQVKAKIAAQMAPKTAQEVFTERNAQFKKSEKEPHKDAQHEMKEQKKAKKIKKEAQDILDMHKNDGALLDEEHTPEESAKMKL